MRILIVEDEYLIAMDVASTLEQAGCAIAGIAGSIAKAQCILDETGCDAAVLDANLDGESSEPIAAALRDRGVPFVVMSGYATDQRIGLLADAPFLRKPCKETELVSAVLALKQHGP